MLVKLTVEARPVLPKASRLLLEASAAVKEEVSRPTCQRKRMLSAVYCMGYNIYMYIYICIP